MKKLIELFISIFKIGAFTFGGGYAMIPLIEEEVVNNKGWLSKEEFVDILIVAQSLPGALAVNTSIFSTGGQFEDVLAVCFRTGNAAGIFAFDYIF